MDLATRTIIKKTQHEKEAILAFMSGCELVAVDGLVTDVVTKEMLHIKNLAYIKEGFAFKEKDIYHLKKYGAAVTDEFFNHVMKKRVTRLPIRGKRITQ